MHFATKVNSKPLDKIAVIAFFIAVFLMVLPVEADIVFGLWMFKRYTEAGLFAACCFIAVLVPVWISWRRQLGQPGVWRGRGYLVTATAILVINGIMTVATVVHNIGK